MRNPKTYTQEELDDAIKALNKQLDSLTQERKVLNTLIKSRKETIKYYQSLDNRQLRID